MTPDMVKMCKCLGVWKVMCKSGGGGGVIKILGNG